MTLRGREPGSGKTAAFLLPTIQKLASHSTIVGARALILSPTRELAQQTMKFAASLATFTDLRACLLVGGDAIEDQVRRPCSCPGTGAHPRCCRSRHAPRRDAPVVVAAAASSRRWRGTQTF